jgi:hypothetical protein
MSNVLTLKTDNPDLFHAEATPHGVNIMTRNDAGMYEHVCLITYESAVTVWMRQSTTKPRYRIRHSFCRC